MIIYRKYSRKSHVLYPRGIRAYKYTGSGKKQLVIFY